jgi:hypothetical protein
MDEPNVTYEPRKQVIIHECARYDSPEQLIRTLFLAAAPGARIVIYWVEGVALSFSGFTHTDSIVKELIEGKVHWNSVSFAPMANYQEQVIVDQLTCKLIDVSNNPTFKAIGKFLRNKPTQTS